MTEAQLLAFAVGVIQVRAARITSRTKARVNLFIVCFLLKILKAWIALGIIPESRIVTSWPDAC